MPGPSTRREFLSTAAALTTLPLAAPWPMLQQGPGRTPQPRASPNAPTNQNVPGGLDIHPTDGPSHDPVFAVNAARVASMVQELYQLALELKQETDRTNLKTTMPVDLVPRTKKIEKLAKGIRSQLGY